MSQFSSSEKDHDSWTISDHNRCPEEGKKIRSEEKQAMWKEWETRDLYLISKCNQHLVADSWIENRPSSHLAIVKLTTFIHHWATNSIRKCLRCHPEKGEGRWVYFKCGFWVYVRMLLGMTYHQITFKSGLVCLTLTCQPDEREQDAKILVTLLASSDWLFLVEKVNTCLDAWMRGWGKKIRMEMKERCKESNRAGFVLWREENKKRKEKSGFVLILSFLI